MLFLICLGGNDKLLERKSSGKGLNNEVLKEVTITMEGENDVISKQEIKKV